MSILFVIPAREGSKGLPGKNIKRINGKSLIQYSIDFAKSFTTESNICVSTDSDEIIEVVEENGLSVPFKRPDHLAQDNSTTSDVLVHAVEYYKNIGVEYDFVVLLQPTSPFRKKEYLIEAIDLLTSEDEMVASVHLTESNPYYVLFEENDDGYLSSCKKLGNITRRQDAPKVFELNGNIYVVNPKKLLEKRDLSKFTKIKKIVMDKKYAVDIDDYHDWEYCEFLIDKYPDLLKI
jgi:CMP-N,N'-diacetyllegionaminic acid synthase